MASHPEGTPGSAREAAKRETRRALLEAALAEFAERGFDAPSLDAICARAGYTRGAFYVHFEDRDELVAAVMEHVLGEFLDAVIAAGGEADDLETTIDRYVALAARGVADPGRPGEDAAALPAPVAFHQVLAACQRTERTRARFVGILVDAAGRVAAAARAGQRAGAVRDDVDAREIAALLVLLALGLRAAADLHLPLAVGPTRDAAVRLLAGAQPAVPGDAGGGARRRSRG